MSLPQFTLTRKLPITVYRKGKDTVVKGRPIPAVETSFIVEANVQPFNYRDLMVLPESDRTKEWIKVYVATSDVFRTDRQGSDGYSADEIIWQGDRFKVMRIQPWRMGVLDHQKLVCARVEISAN